MHIWNKKISSDQMTGRQDAIKIEELKEKTYPIIYTQQYIEQCFGELSGEEVVVTQQILDIKKAFAGVLERVDSLSGDIQSFQETFQGIKQAASAFDLVRDDIIHSVESAQVKVRSLKDGSEQVGDSFQAMDENFQNLEGSVEDIKECTEGIIKVANQTNMLALNASIEAARAGEQGRGFAVVAEQVRELAEQIKKLITMINQRVSNVEEETQKLSESLEVSKKLLKDNGDNVDSAQTIFEDIKTSAGQVEEVKAGIASAIQVSEKSVGDVSDYVVMSKKYYDEVMKCIQDIESSDGKKTIVFDNIRNMLCQVKPLTEMMTDRQDA